MQAAAAQECPWFLQSSGKTDDKVNSCKGVGEKKKKEPNQTIIPLFSDDWHFLVDAYWFLN